MTKKIVLALIPFLYLLFACNNYNNSPANYRRFTPRDSSYSVAFPNTWEAHRGRKDFQLMLISPKVDSSDKFQENVIIFRENMESENLDNYEKNLIEKKLPQSVKNFNLLVNKKIQINNLNAVKLEYGFLYKTPVKSLGYIFSKDGFAYVVLCTAPDSTYANFKGTFINIANSFKFNKIR